LNWLRLGDPKQARTHTTKALECCATQQDADGIRIYTENLAHLDRLETAV
jgi:hypothetical protein